MLLIETLHLSIVENDLTNKAEGEESDNEDTDGERNLESPQDFIS